MMRYFQSAFLAALLTVLFSSISWSAEGSFAGVETCKACHEDQNNSYKASVHSRKALKGTPAVLNACESCHGPGAEHASKGGGRGVAITGFSKKADAGSKAAACLACHEETKELAFWKMGRHKSEGLSCDACHSVHEGTGKGLKKSQPDLCYDCHKDIRMQAGKQSHHPIREGKVVCSDCHNPHGGFGSKMIKADSVNELCYKCHAEKRGPYRFEHPPVEENCLNCHEAHGSNHNRLLVRKAPQLCQSCHETDAFLSHANVPYNKRDGYKNGAPNAFLLGRACMNCHTNIHGSNGPSSNGQRFFR